MRLSRGRNNREGTSKLLFLLLLGLFLLSFHRLQRSIPIPIRRILRKVDLALEEESKFSMRKKDGSGSVGLLSIGPQKAVKCNLVYFLCLFSIGGPKGFLENSNFDVESCFDVFEHNLVVGRLLRRTSSDGDKKKLRGQNYYLRVE